MTIAIRELTVTINTDSRPSREALERLQDAHEETLKSLAAKADRLHTAAHTAAGHTTGPWRRAFEALKDAVDSARLCCELVPDIGEEEIDLRGCQTWSGT